MYYNTLVTYRDPSTGGLNNVIGLYHAKNDAEVLGMAISGAEESVPKGHQIVTHEEGANEYQALLIKTLAKAITNSVSATGGLND